MRAAAPCSPQIGSTADMLDMLPPANARVAANGPPSTAPPASAPVQPMNARPDSRCGDRNRADEDERRRAAAMGTPPVYWAMGAPGGSTFTYMSSYYIEYV